MKFKESMIIEYGAYAKHFVCSKCSPSYVGLAEHGAEVCDEQMPIFHSEQSAILHGWLKLVNDRWACPECAKEMKNESKSRLSADKA